MRRQNLKLFIGEPLAPITRIRKLNRLQTAMTVLIFPNTINERQLGYRYEQTQKPSLLLKK